MTRSPHPTFLADRVRRRLIGAGGLACAVVALPARAHHGWSSFDETAPIWIEGTVRDVRWQNPHAELIVERAPEPRLPDDLATRLRAHYEDGFSSLGLRRNLTANGNPASAIWESPDNCIQLIVDVDVDDFQRRPLRVADDGIVAVEHVGIEAHEILP